MLCHSISTMHRAAMLSACVLVGCFFATASAAGRLVEKDITFAQPVERLNLGDTPLVDPPKR
jgi:hypothetical protein